MADIEIVQGDTWQCQVQWTNPVPGSDPPEPDPNSPINITGYTARLQIRARPGDAAVLTLTSSPAAGLVVTGLTGTVGITASAAQTGLITAGEYLWELEVTSPAGVVTTIVPAALFRVAEQVAV